MLNNTIEYKGFIGSVHFNFINELFFGKIIGITDTVTFEAKTVDKLVTAFHKAVDDYLFVCKETGKQPQEEFKGSFNITVNPELHKKAVQKASVLGISLNQLVSNALKKELSDMD